MKNFVTMGSESFILSDLFNAAFFELDFLSTELIKFSDSGIDLKYLEIENPRMYSRRTLHILTFLKKIGLEKLIKGFSPERIGIYCCSYTYLIPLEVIEARQVSKLSISKSVRLNCSPNFGLIHSGGILPSHISIKYKFKGPTNFFIEGATSQIGAAKAYQKAAFDLKLNKVDLAIVVCANIFDGPMHVSNHLKRIKSSGVSLREAISCSLLDASTDFSCLPVNANQARGLNEDLGIVQTLNLKSSVWETVL